MFALSACRVLRYHTAAIRLPLTAGCKQTLLGAYKPTFNGHRLQQTLIRRHYQQKRTAVCQHNTVRSIREIWNKLFGKYLLATNIISSGLLMIFGDIVAQQIVIQSDKGTIVDNFDWERIVRMFIVGALLGPIHHYAYIWMDRVMPVANFRNTIYKILLDQFVMSPVCLITFFYSACHLEGKNIRDANKEFIQKFPYIYLLDWLMWPEVQYINFRYLDTKYRVLFVNVCTALYNIVLSYMKHDFSIK